VSSNIAIIDYGRGNLGSIQHALYLLDQKADIVSKAEDLSNYQTLILPGVGHFKKGKEALDNLGFTDALKDAANKNKKILGICLGMQLLLDYSEEGNCEGLGLVPGKVVKFTASDLIIPHMGWNWVQPKATNLFNDFEKWKFYFVHSYYASAVPNENILAETLYGKNFVSAVFKNNVVGVQFHPEKSHKYGLSFLKSFLLK
jgi:glutamine amidotransferase